MDARRFMNYDHIFFIENSYLNYNRIFGLRFTCFVNLLTLEHPKLWLYRAVLYGIVNQTD